MKNFEEYFYATFDVDPLYEGYVQAWAAYHMAADQIDGRLPFYDRSLNAYAISEGLRAMRTVMPGANLSGDKEWQSAKLEALRRLNKN